MYLLAESGSTKTDWREFNEEKVLAKFRTSGMNPDILPEDTIETQLREDLANNLYYRSPEKVFFYGAGLAGGHTRAVVERILTRIFPSAQIFVFHDMLAAARSTAFDKPGIACILGTGSNTCYYDGQRITRRVGGQGYLFGDEGSGADLGKNLLKRALHGDLAPELVQKLEQWIGLPVLEIRTEVHHSKRPNVYLARLSRFVHENLNLPEMQELVSERMEKFLRRAVCRHPEYQDVPVYFVGSIAWYYKDYLFAECAKKGITPGDIDQSPVDELVRYHQKYGEGPSEPEKIAETRLKS
ncbi:MAG: hypothetical protein H6581_20350 [Bacteroidia bacterium]|nr:hypothetical protein [Bacteroidia bacterium]